MGRSKKYFLLTASIVSLTTCVTVKATSLLDRDDAVRAWSISQVKTKVPAVKLSHRPPLCAASVQVDYWGQPHLRVQHERFTEFYMLGDGNCFYSAMGTTHEAVRRLLLDNAHMPFIRHLGHAEIVDEFDHLPQAFHRMKSYRNLVEEKKVIAAVLAIADLEPEVRRENLDRQNQLFQRIATWAVKEKVFKAYVTHVLKDGHWMMFHEDRTTLPKRTYFVDVVARLLNKELTIWGQVDHRLNRMAQRPAEAQGEYVIPLHRYDPGTRDASKAHLIHRENHYNRLVGTYQGRHDFDTADADEQAQLARYIERESMILSGEGFFCRYQKLLQGSLDALMAGDSLTATMREKVTAWRQALVPTHVTQGQVDSMIVSLEDEQAFRMVLLRAYALFVEKLENEEKLSEEKERTLLSSRAILQALKVSLADVAEIPEERIVRETSRLHQSLTAELSELQQVPPRGAGSQGFQNQEKESLLKELMVAVGLLNDTMVKEIGHDLKWSYLKKCQNSEKRHQEKITHDTYINEFSQLQDHSFVRQVFDDYEKVRKRKKRLNTDLLLADPYLCFYNNDISLDPAYRAPFPQDRWAAFVDEVTGRLVALCGYEGAGTRELLWSTLDKADVTTPLGERTRKRYQRILDTCLSEAATQTDSAEVANRNGYEAFFLFVSQNRDRCIDGLNIAATDFELKHLAHVDSLSEAEKLGLAISSLLEKDRQRFIDQFGELGFEVEEMLYIPAMLRNRLMPSFSLTGAAFDLDNPIVARGWDPLFAPENAARLYLEGGRLRREAVVEIQGAGRHVAREVDIVARTPDFLETLLYNAYLRGESIRGLRDRSFNSLTAEEQDRLRTAERLGYLETMPLSDFAQTQEDMRNELESCIYILDESDPEFVPKGQRRFFNETAPLFKKAFFGHILRKFGWIIDPQLQQDVFWMPSGQDREEFFVQKLTKARKKLNDLIMAEFQLPKDFDPWHYLYLHDDVMKAAKESGDLVRFACWHYQEFGGPRGERLHRAKMPVGFSVKGYRLLNPDIDEFVDKMPQETIKGFLEAHFAKNAEREARLYDLPAEYDPMAYLLQHPDLQSVVYRSNLTLAKTLSWLAQHYVNHGRAENRPMSLPAGFESKRYQGNRDNFVMPIDFFPIRYLLLNPDLQTVFRSLPYKETLSHARSHFETFGWRENRPY
ncbi:MAG: hypothetical protein ACK5TR_02360 [Alphaproteobacteria bacterium]|jgi:hypothetical protein|nr:hypothetical protein [Alphaproteobacteria bacterium]